MSVYFIRNEKGRIKIGSAVNPDSRLRDLLTSTDENLTLIGTKPGGASEERRLHRQFAFAHVVREWFDPVPELLAFIMEASREVILFTVGNTEFPMEIIDHNNEKWVTRKQLADALGVSDLHKLHGRMIDRGELKEGIHWNTCTVESSHQVCENPERFFEGVDDMTIPSFEGCNESLHPSKRSTGGAQLTVVYSYRGIIRMAMASEGTRAVAFRDWAEDVLYKVMTTGGYGEAHVIKDLQDRVSLLEKRTAHMTPEMSFQPPSVTAQSLRRIIADEAEAYCTAEHRNPKDEIRHSIIVYNNMIMFKMATIVRFCEGAHTGRGLKPEIRKTLARMGFNLPVKPTKIAGKAFKVFKMPLAVFTSYQQ